MTLTLAYGDDRNMKNKTFGFCKTRTLLTLGVIGGLIQAAGAQTWYIGTTNANSITQETAWQTAVGGAPVETFDQMPLNTPLGPIPSVGLNVRTYTDNTQAIVMNGGGTFTRSGTQFLWNTSHQQTFFDATSPLMGFAFWDAGGDSDVDKVTIFDSQNNVIGSNFVTAEPVLPCFLGVTSNTPIYSILIEPAGAGGTQNSLGFDNIQTKAAPAPEPASCAVLAIGGIALKYRARRKRV